MNSKEEWHQKYEKQKANAKYRNIEWNITFSEWRFWWMNTGHFHERGHRKNEYVMARFNDQGPYELGNIKCITHLKNIIEGLTDRSLSQKSRAKIKKSLTGVKHSAERNAKKSKSLKGIKKPPRTKEHTEKIAAKNRGRKNSEQTLANMRQAQQNRRQKENETKT